MAVLDAVDVTITVNGVRLPGVVSTEFTVADIPCAWERAHDLLVSRLTPYEREFFRCNGFVQVVTEQFIYDIFLQSKTRILDRRFQLKGYSCLQLTIPAPDYDRVLAEYLLIKNDERRYWKTANIFYTTFVVPCTQSAIWVFAFLFALDIALFVRFVSNLLPWVIGR